MGLTLRNVGRWWKTQKRGCLQKLSTVYNTVPPDVCYGHWVYTREILFNDLSPLNTHTNTHTHPMYVEWFPISLSNTETAYLALAICPSRKLNWNKQANKTISKVPTINVSWNELNTLQVMINIMCYFPGGANTFTWANAINNHTAEHQQFGLHGNRR